MKRMIAIILTITSIVTSLTGCSGILASNENGAFDEIVTYTIDDVEGNKFYVKSGDSYQPIYMEHSSFDGDVASTVSPSRVIWYTKDDVKIPTLYKDGQLVYFTAGKLPKIFTWERFEDFGYSIGICNLKKNDIGKFSILDPEDLVLPRSSIFDTANVEDTEITVDRVSDVVITDEYVSRAGTIKGLQKNESYNIDLYAGTNSLSGKFTADSRIFASYELYETTDCYFEDAYMVVDIPESFVSGYYYINGVGLFRYVDKERHKVIIQEMEQDDNGELLIVENDMVDEIDFNTLNESEEFKKSSIIFIQDGEYVDTVGEGSQETDYSNDGK